MDDFSALLWPKPLGPSPEAEVGAAEGLEAEQEVGLKVERGDAQMPMGSRHKGSRLSMKPSTKKLLRSIR